MKLRTHARTHARTFGTVELGLGSGTIALALSILAREGDDSSRRFDRVEVRNDVYRLGGCFEGVNFECNSAKGVKGGWW